MALDFPNSPTTGQIFAGGGGLWRFDGVKWAPARYGSFTISDTAPPTPQSGDMWFDSVGCQTYFWYTDPNSSQWVPIVNQLGSAVVIGATPPPSPQNGQLWWDSGGSGQLYCYFNDGTSSQWVAVSSTGQAQGQLGGYLSYVSATQLQFLPFNGNQIQINGLRYTIPNTGITGLTNTNCYVEGVAGQSLVGSPATVYRVYCFNNAGVLTADFSQTAHATSQSPGNSGVEIKSGDDSRTFIGLVLMGGGANPGQFYDQAQFRYTRSWVNRKRISFGIVYNSTLSSTTSVILTSCGFVTFADEAVLQAESITGTFAAAPHTAFFYNNLDGVLLSQNCNLGVYNAGAWMSVASSGAEQVGEGQHTATAAGYVDGSTLTYYITLSGTIG